MVTSTRRKLWIPSTIGLMIAALAVLLWANSDTTKRLPVSLRQSELASKFAALGAENVESNGRPDKGMTIGGTLDGRQFALAIPPRWNGKAVLFAHGYSVPGSPVHVSDDPVSKDPSGGLMAIAYDQNYAVGHSAYDKAGIAVESGAKATLALSALLRRLSVKRVYVAGGSMGGNIVMALIEKNPHAFDGALSACGVTTGWQEEIGALIDFRAVYMHFTTDTPYALPGDQNLDRSALSASPPSVLAFAGTPWRLLQMKRIAAPVELLFEDAEREPNGQAAGIVRKVASLVPFEPEPASFLLPLMTVTLGQDDLKASFGGNVYGNLGKHYQSGALADEEVQNLNSNVQRIARDPSAASYADRWHRTKGNLEVPLVAIHNRIDSLVPYTQAEGLLRQATEAGNSRRLVLFSASPVKAAIPGTKMRGYTHCGFSPQQIGQAWNTLRSWVENGVRQEAIRPGQTS